MGQTKKTREINGFLFFIFEIFFFTPQALNWGGGLGGTGFACRICHFVAKNLESLVTHTGYKHSLFYEFMSEDMQKEYRDIADKVGEKLW